MTRAVGPAPLFQALQYPGPPLQAGGNPRGHGSHVAYPILVPPRAAG